MAPIRERRDVAAAARVIESDAVKANDRSIVVGSVAVRQWKAKDIPGMENQRKICAPPYIVCRDFA